MGTARAPVVGSGAAPAWIWRVSKPQSAMAVTPRVGRRSDLAAGSIHGDKPDQFSQLLPGAPAAGGQRPAQAQRSVGRGRLGEPGTGWALPPANGDAVAAHCGDEPGDGEEDRDGGQAPEI